MNGAGKAYAKCPMDIMSLNHPPDGVSRTGTADLRLLWRQHEERASHGPGWEGHDRVSWQRSWHVVPRVTGKFPFQVFWVLRLMKSSLGLLKIPRYVDHEHFTPPKIKNRKGEQGSSGVAFVTFGYYHLGLTPLMTHIA